MIVASDAVLYAADITGQFFIGSRNSHRMPLSTWSEAATFPVRSTAAPPGSPGFERIANRRSRCI
jgi:hypothetical protein